MDFDVVFLSRLQFALTIMFHYLFPPLTIGLGALIVIYETLYLKTRDQLWKSANVFWIKLFAVTFAVGVATGIVMEFEFGTNWANYSRFVGDVFGSALAAEGIFAFFLESGFLAVLVFGRDRVGKKFYYFAAWMVFIGSVFSSVWIVVANSWQQTPNGSLIQQMTNPATGEPWFIDGIPQMRAQMQNFWQVVFNPSSIDRITHVWAGCAVTGGFFVLSICSWYILRNKHLEFAQRCFKVALIFSLLGILGSVLTGDSNARMVAQQQPAKLAAMEGIYKTGDGPTPIHLFGIPNSETGEVDYSIEIPGALSILVYREFPPKTPVIGLDQFKPENHPPVFIPFTSFHIMVGLGFALLGLIIIAFFFWWRRTLFQQRWLMYLFVVSILAAITANELGWVSAEVGRQPWIVYPPMQRTEAGEPLRDADGIIQFQQAEWPTESGSVNLKPAGLRTRDGHSQAVVQGEVLFSIVMFGLIYTLLFFVWIFVLNEKIRKGPAPASEAATAPEGFLRTAGEHAHDSMTSMREGDQDEEGNEDEDNNKKDSSS
ncbi:Cytochrome bd-I ubiquinol oxidase subunit 1 [Poriferisphaera corsica]|uniref:Cytochrome bd-I ubiquinol oxidase subunit 1 n=1 Tax=Poriferisphaera corsica TaxID=2528020 RepID=A0A517YQQ0_9BACT|nr:cytochrome ubiquinol oxidase subunit I [Poriferisphaera corsica]QDU32538.1 Cytochrome bd-I ubiquinol oxidase subunit 1 [Poriferisphaera corsica]